MYRATLDMPTGAGAKRAKTALARVRLSLISAKQAAWEASKQVGQAVAAEVLPDRGDRHVGVDEFGCFCPKCPVRVQRAARAVATQRQ